MLRKGNTQSFVSLYAELGKTVILKEVEHRWSLCCEMLEEKASRKFDGMNKGSDLFQVYNV